MEQNKEQKLTSEKPIISGQYDIVSKSVIQQNPKDWVQFGLGISDVQFVQLLETEQPTVRSNRADSFMQAKVNDRDVIIHFEFQTRDSTEKLMPHRIAGYAGRGIETYEMPVFSHVVYLHPDAGQNDPGAYIQEVHGYNIYIQYKVIRLSDLSRTRFSGCQNKGSNSFRTSYEGTRKSWN